MKKTLIMISIMETTLLHGMIKQEETNIESVNESKESILITAHRKEWLKQLRLWAEEGKNCEDAASALKIILEQALIAGIKLGKDIDPLKMHNKKGPQEFDLKIWAIEHLACNSFNLLLEHGASIDEQDSKKINKRLKKLYQSNAPAGILNKGINLLIIKQTHEKKQAGLSFETKKQ
jgi:hypothetical protein